MEKAGEKSANPKQATELVKKVGKKANPKQATEPVKEVGKKANPKNPVVAAEQRTRPNTRSKAEVVGKLECIYIYIYK